MKKRFLSLLLVFIITIGLLSSCNSKNNGIEKATENTVASTTTITDQLGRKVDVPVGAKRILCMQHHTLDIITELQAQDNIIGVMKSWEDLLGSYIGEVFPKIKELPTPGEMKDYNIEEVIKLKPDVIFASNQLSENTLKQLEDAKIPVVTITLYIADREQASTINPQLINPDEAYTEGLKEAIEIISTIVNKKDKGEKLWDYVVNNRKIVSDHLSRVSEEKRIKTYMANENMETYGTGKYVGVAMEKAGAKNVAEEINGYKQVTMEQVVKWNPEVIFVQSRYSKVLEEIKNDPAWSIIDAVKNDRLYIAPDYTKPWGNPAPESMALGELWLAKTLYPEQFKDVNLENMVKEFYKEFYGLDYVPESK